MLCSRVALFIRAFFLWKNDKGEVTSFERINCIDLYIKSIYGKITLLVEMEFAWNYHSQGIGTCVVKLFVN